MDEITIARRFCGPPASGNGGYVCGRVAAFIEGPAEVTLRLPPPLETPLAVVRGGQDVRLLHGDQLVAEGRPCDFEFELPEVPSWSEAQAAGSRYLGLRQHDWPSCFVCSPQRSDGLRIFCGSVTSGPAVAGTWVPASDLADGTGAVRPEFLWAAMDCPGAWSVIGQTDAAGVPAPSSPLLLGRLAGRLVQPLQAGEECIAMGWPLACHGRKYDVGAAIFTRDGHPVCYSRATWIAVRRAPDRAG